MALQKQKEEEEGKENGEIYFKGLAYVILQAGSLSGPEKS